MSIKPEKKLSFCLNRVGVMEALVAERQQQQHVLVSPGTRLKPRMTRETSAGPHNHSGFQSHIHEEFRIYSEY